jgi:hypothetical protein
LETTERTAANASLKKGKKKRILEYDA